jgi:Mn2+/Fe2+ NRAMP family transporter
MPDGLGILILFVVVVMLMVVVFWRHKKVAGAEGSQELLVQLTRTAIALLSTISVFYAMLKEIPISEGLLALYGVIITLYFKGEKILQPPTASEKEIPGEGTEQEAN